MLKKWTYPLKLAELDQVPLVLAIGTFDGVHKGHDAVVKAAVSLAASCGDHVLPMAWTFDPPPWAFFQKGNFKQLFLTPLAAKAEKLLCAGMQGVHVLEFDEKVSSLTPPAFLANILCRFPLAGVVVGFNFTFGKDRAGTAHALQQWLAEYDIPVVIVPPVSIAGEVVSSTRIRRLLAAGEVRDVFPLLGRFYSVTGRVVVGDRRGHTLGFPTANLVTEQPFLLPCHGVYVVLIKYKDKHFPGVLHYGQRPTFAGQEERLEIHLFGFKGSLYGEFLFVEFLDFIRPVKSFSSVQSLCRQIEMDIEHAKKIIAKSSWFASSSMVSYNDCSTQ